MWTKCRVVRIKPEFITRKFHVYSKPVFQCWIFVVVCVNCLLFVSVFNETRNMAKKIVKIQNITFHNNPLIRSRVVSCWRSDEQTDMTRPIVDFRNCFAKVSKIPGIKDVHFGWKCTIYKYFELR